MEAWYFLIFFSVSKIPERLPFPFHAIMPFLMSYWVDFLTVIFVHPLHPNPSRNSWPQSSTLLPSRWWLLCWQKFHPHKTTETWGICLFSLVIFWDLFVQLVIFLGFVCLVGDFCCGLFFMVNVSKIHCPFANPACKSKDILPRASHSLGSLPWGFTPGREWELVLKRRANKTSVCGHPGSRESQ